MAIDVMNTLWVNVFSASLVDQCGGRLPGATALDRYTKDAQELADAALASYQRVNRPGIHHGSTCPKVAHTGTGYLHDEDDDSRYGVDGVWYCGRCHMAI